MSGQEYDPEARRDTALARVLVERIARQGPVSVREYMAACLVDPVHGYYRTRAAIGQGGDFITAPEISQVFGELIGLWAAVVWQRMGAPARIDLVELGGGRGTLMRDAVRAMRVVPGLLAALRVHMVEVSPVLGEQQRACLAGAGVPMTWHGEPATVGQAMSGYAAEGPATQPTILVGNEFLDTGPVEQLVFSDGRWRERRIGVDERGALQFLIGDVTPDGPPPLEGGVWAEGDIAERHEFGAREAGPGFARGFDSETTQPVAALLIDYGHLRSGPGETLQAVRGHRFEHPLTSPGEADLSVQVDFAQVGDAARRAGLAVDGPVVQAEFLGRLGIMERASRLMAANPGQANAIETGIARLMAPAGMGGRFKAIGVRSPQLARLPGFGA